MTTGLSASGRMRLVLRAFVAMGLAWCFVGHVAAAAPAEVHILLDSDAGRWCAYSSADVWRREAERQTRTREYGTVRFAGNDVSSLEWVVEAESGDWIVYDDYKVARGGMTLRREHRFAGPRLGLVARYRIRGGKAVRTSLEGFDLATGRPTPPQARFVPQVRLVTSPAAFPFLPAVAGLRRSGKGRFCSA